MTTYNLGHVVGEKGEKGDQGERGPQGPKGDKGDPGEGVTIVTSWSSTLSDSKIPSEKLAKNTLDTKQATLVSGSNIKTINNTSILGSGNIDIQGTGVDIDTSFPSTLSDTHVPSTKLVKNSLDGKVTGTKVTSWSSTLADTNIPSEKLVKDTIDGLSIPTKISDLTNDSDFIETSSTSGLIKNDGTIDTSAYITSSALSTYVQKSSTSGLIKNDGSIDTNTYVDTDDIANNLTTTTAGKVLDARQGKALADLIGDAIDYINL